MPRIALKQDAAGQRVNRQRVLILENDQDSLQKLRGSLTQSGFEVTAPRKGEDVQDVVDREKPHLVLVDWEHPGIDTRNLIDHIRHSAPPAARIIALSAYASEQQIVAGLELGLDEYMLRPYSLPVVAARARSILRAGQQALRESELLQFHRLRLDLLDLRLMVEDAIVPLRPMELRMLEFLMRHPERVFTRSQMLERVWTAEWRVAERAVDVHVQRTRKTLALYGCGNYLQTVRSFGYRLSVL